jgi:hypothetical protein
MAQKKIIPNRNFPKFKASDAPGPAQMGGGRRSVYSRFDLLEDKTRARMNAVTERFGVKAEAEEMVDTAAKELTKNKVYRRNNFGYGKGAVGETLGAVGSVLGVAADLKEADKNAYVGKKSGIVGGPLGGPITRDFGSKARKRKA